VDLDGTKILSAVSRSYGIKRQRLIDILSRRALDVGVHIEYGHEVTTPSQLPEVDLIVASDGLNSRIRDNTVGLHANISIGKNKYIWLATDKVFESFTWPFVHTDSGWIWGNAYAVDNESSTFIVECPPETWKGLGFDTIPAEDCLPILEKIFEHQLDGHQILGQAPDQPPEETNIQWLNFRRITNDHWYSGQTVLMGDAAHTAHFSIGSGTTLAIGDAIALADNMQRHENMRTALAAYEKERKAAILQAQIAALCSMQWFENVDRYIDLKPRQFSTVLRRRRSPLLPHLPPRLYYWLWLNPTSHELPATRRARKWIAPRIVKVYNRFTRSAG
jgi:2-polyprenyl-6-methoxyphenol hydroxylase-like FAD-dependent oxidoreductase